MSNPLAPRIAAASSHPARVGDIAKSRKPTPEGRGWCPKTSKNPLVLTRDGNDVIVGPEQDAGIRHFTRSTLHGLKYPTTPPTITTRSKNKRRCCGIALSGRPLCLSIVRNPTWWFDLLRSQIHPTGWSPDHGAIKAESQLL